ncbi:hypothetical protein [Bacillus cereus]|uniref:hypothetical protein n=1 Tax=Bacillus cereus group TaxID=86661 RepID=UPI001BAB1003|nr:hypothetical protein [Bacillus cereus]MBR9658768.1 hypothetical protein [Bacillus cereus]
MKVITKKFRVLFYFDNENTRSIEVEADNRKQVIQDIEGSSWYGNDDVRVNLANVTHFKIREV